MKLPAKYKGITLGAWRVLPEESDKDYLRIRGTVLGGRYKVANVMCVSYNDTNPAYAELNRREKEQSHANATIMADAPRLAADIVRLRDVLQNIANAERANGHGRGAEYTLQLVAGAAQEALESTKEFEA